MSHPALVNDHDINKSLLSQADAPYLDAIIRYSASHPARFHTPGHKGASGVDEELLWFLGENAFLLDVPRDIRGIDKGPEPTPYTQAEQLAAEAHGAAKTWFLSNGASQGNHALSLALAKEGDVVISQRNVHLSLLNGLMLSGGTMRFINPSFDTNLDISLSVSPDKLELLLQDTPQAKAVFLVSPTYDGVVSDIAACSEVCAKHHVPLVVDQSWGSHFGFSSAVPQSAMRLGADVVLTSSHKLGGSFTQSALLHLKENSIIDPEIVSYTLNLIRSTSPNSLLLSSLDASRRMLATQGEQMLSDTVTRVTEFRKALQAIPNVQVIAKEDLTNNGFVGLDPLKVLVDLSRTGWNGYQAMQELEEQCGVYAEMGSPQTVLFLIGPGESQTELDKALEGMRTLMRTEPPAHAISVPRLGPPPSSDGLYSPRSVFCAEQEKIPLAESVGRIAAEMVSGYPPGIPVILPGEPIEEQTIPYLQALVAAGVHIKGPRDPLLNHISVCK